MFRVREKQIKKAINSLTSALKKTKVYGVSPIIPKVKASNVNFNIFLNTKQLRTFNQVKIKSYNLSDISLPTSVFVKSGLKFFNSMKLIFKPVEISELPKKQLIELIADFHKKTLLPFNSIQLEALYTDIPIKGNEKISFENGNLLINSDSKALHNEKSVVIIFRENKNKKSRVAVISV